MYAHRILWGHELENNMITEYINDDANSLNQVMLRIVLDCETDQIPFIILSRCDGNSWEEQHSGGDGSSIYWESILSQPDNSIISLSKNSSKMDTKSSPKNSRAT